MRENSQQLLQALSTRICNDLAGSVGTINNCLTLLDNKDKSIRRKARTLLDEESSNVIKRIQYFRECYGLSEKRQRLSALHFSKLIKDFFYDNEVSQVLYFEDNLMLLDTVIIQAIICLLAISREHLNPSGNIDIFFSNSQNKSNIKIITSGKNLKQKKESLAILKQDNLQNIPISVQNCREYYINILCDKSGYNLKVKKTKNILEYILTKKVYL